jgi:ABC-2 type transport system ATP-binding protein
MVHSPPILVLDEPTAGVDVELRQQLWDYVRRLNSQGVTIVLTTHYLEEAEKLCDRIAIIHRGVILAQNSLAGLRAATGKHYLEDIFVHYVRDVPELQIPFVDRKARSV